MHSNRRFFYFIAHTLVNLLHKFCLQLEKTCHFVQSDWVIDWTLLSSNGYSVHISLNSKDVVKILRIGQAREWDNFPLNYFHYLQTKKNFCRKKHCEWIESEVASPISVPYFLFPPSSSSSPRRQTQNEDLVPSIIGFWGQPQKPLMGIWFGFTFVFRLSQEEKTSSLLAINWSTRPTTISHTLSVRPSVHTSFCPSQIFKIKQQSLPAWSVGWPSGSLMTPVLFGLLLKLVRILREQPS